MRVFIGYDSRESVAFHVLSHSIMRHAIRPISITPLALDNLKGLYLRKRENQSTEFSFSRFLVPYLSDFIGWSLYLDCDMLCREDLWNVAEYINRGTWKHDVLVCQHDYAPKKETKFLGNTQVAYPKKNWSSLMLFNNARCAKLTPDYVNTAPAADLHQFAWAKSVGAIELRWNWLVGEYDKNDKAGMAHFTNGTPCFPGYAQSDYAEEWFHELAKASHVDA